jgi:hypothetical protein
MLQMLNVDNRRSNNETYNHSDHESGSDNERSKGVHSKRDRELLLPIVKPVGAKLNMSDGNIGAMDDLPTIDDDHLRPRV